MEKKILTKHSRSEIKIVESESDQDEIVWGGLYNGRIAFWDLRSNKSEPE